MNFFEDQRLAKKKTNKLYAMFLGVVAFVSLGTGLVISTLLTIELNGFESTPDNYYPLTFGQEYIIFFLAASSIVLGAILIISLFKIHQLKSDPESICYALGAEKLPPNPKSFKEAQYRNIVEEMSIASAVPVPTIFILEDDAINAFACGFDINSAAICVTTGALAAFNRDELQAVVAHEYSHILNGDMTINLKLVGMLAGILVIYQIGNRIMRSRSRNSKDNSAAVGFAIMLLGAGGLLFGSLLKAAISRQREFLADASSVQFTRNPDGIIGALKKISVNSSEGILASTEANEVSHMFLVEGVKRKFFSFATHPDLFDRIKAIDKNFDEDQFLKQEFDQVKKQMLQEKKTLNEPAAAKGNANGMTTEQARKVLLPLLLLYQNKPQAQMKLSPEGLLRNFILGEDEEIKNLSWSEKLNILEILFGQINAFDHNEKRRIYQVIKDAIKEDGKIDFSEFIIFAYLRPALKSVSIKPKKLSAGKFNDYANRVLNMLLYMDQNELTQDLISALSEFVEFSQIDRSELKYAQMLPILDEIRFCNIDQKEKLLKACDKLIHFNTHISEKEEVLLSLIKQILGVPGTA